MERLHWSLQCCIGIENFGLFSGSCKMNIRRTKSVSRSRSGVYGPNFSTRHTISGRRAPAHRCHLQSGKAHLGQSLPPRGAGLCCQYHQVSAHSIGAIHKVPDTHSGQGHTVVCLQRLATQAYSCLQTHVIVAYNTSHRACNEAAHENAQRHRTTFLSR
jgi:hypothetical protein